MSGLDEKQSIKLYVGEELTKETIVDELSNAIAFLKTTFLPNSRQPFVSTLLS